MTDNEMKIFEGSGYYEDSSGKYVLDLESCLELIDDEKQKALKNIESSRVIQQRELFSAFRKWHYKKDIAWLTHDQYMNAVDKFLAEYSG